MTGIASTAICAALVASLLVLPGTTPSHAASAAYCKAYAKKKADGKMGPKAAENAMLMGATGGIAGKSADGKKTFTGFGLAGATIGLIVSNEKRAKFYRQYYSRCMTKA